MVRLFTLGSVALFDREGTHLSCEATQSKRLALLAYLATGSCLHRRDKLVGLFWPDSDHAHARASLNRSLHYLRRLAGEDAIESVGRESVRLDPERIHSDAWYFRRAIEAGELDVALDLYRGDYLEGLFLKGLGEFEEWVDGERRELHAMAETAARHLAERAFADGRLEEAVACARKAMELAPHDGAAVGRLLEMMAGCGDRAGALKVFAQFEITLEREFGIEPTEELRAVVSRIRDGGIGMPPTPNAADPWVAPVGDDPCLAEPVGGTVVGCRGESDRAPAGEQTRRTPPRAAVTGKGGWMPNLARALLFAVGLSGMAWVAKSLGSDTDALPRFVVVVPFENRTGDPSLESLTAALAAEIVQRIATATPAGAIAQEWRPGSGAVGRVDRGRATVQVTGAELAVTGIMYARGDSVVFHTRISDGLDSHGPHVLEPVEILRSDALADMEEVVDRISAAAASHIDLGHESLLYRPPSSLEAYREFRRGVDLDRAGEVDQAVAHLNRSAELDADFVRPLLAVAHVYRRSGRPERATRFLADLEGRRGSLRPVEVLEVDFQLAAVDEDTERTVAAARRLADTAPITWSYEAGLWELRVNRPGAALERFEQAMGGISETGIPGRPEYWAHWSDALHRLDQHDEALRVARDGRRHHPESEALLEREIAALAGLGRLDEVDRQIWKSALHREGHCVWLAALELKAHGHEEAAMAAARSAIRLGTHPLIEVQAALHFEGDDERAATMMRTLRVDHPDELEYLGMRGVVAARQQDLATLLDVDRDLVLWNDPHAHGRPTFWRAKIAAARGEHVSAVRLLSQAVAEGMHFSQELHRDLDLSALSSYSVFQDFMRPADR